MRASFFIIFSLLFSPTRAQVTDRSGVKDVNQVVDNTPDSIAKAMTARPVPGSSRKGNNPVLFLIGRMMRGVHVPASLEWATTH